MSEPYIGMTDVPDAAWLQRMIEAFIDAGGDLRPGGHRLHAGVMASRKSLNGTPHDWEAVWPRPEKIAGIFVRHPRVLNALHYAGYNSVDVEQSLRQAVACGGPNLDALQLDMVWPDPRTIARLKASHPHLRFILQVSAVALDRCGNDPEIVAALIEAYERTGSGPVAIRVIDDVLLDKSMGEGVGMDARTLLPFLRSIAASQPGLGLVVAGGLGPDTLDLVDPIINEFPRVSIDAQGRLRPSGRNTDPIDFAMAQAYLRRFIKKLPPSPHA